MGKLSAQLRPAILDDLGLEAAIKWEAQVFAERTNCNYTLDLKNKKMSQDRDRNTAVFRIFQEALTNVTRHAKATEVAAFPTGGGPWFVPCDPIVDNKLKRFEEALNNIEPGK